MRKFLTGLLCVFAAVAVEAVTISITPSNVGEHRTLQNGNTYMFAEDVEFAAEICTSALSVADGATVEIRVSEGVKVKLTGGAGDGTAGAGAGIEVPTNATLVISGAGELTAIGGAGGGGANGMQGGAGVTGRDDNYSTTSSGGVGGAGGGGGGAGEGGPWGMAVLAAFAARSEELRVKREKCEGLEDFLVKKVFKRAKKVTLKPTKAGVKGYAEYLKRFVRAIGMLDKIKLKML